MCAGLLGWFAIGHGRMMWEHHFVFWTAMAHWAPRLLIRILVNLIFYAVALVYLTRPRVVAWFGPRAALVGTA